MDSHDGEGDGAERPRSVEQFDDEHRREIEEIIVAGREFLRIARTDDAKSVATAVNLWLDDMKGSATQVSREDLLVVALAYCDALAKATGLGMEVCL